MDLNLHFIQLLKIEFVDRDVVIPAYKKGVTEWMAQWTVANNFKAYVVHIDELDINVDEISHVMAILKKQHFDWVRQHFQSCIPEDLRTGYRFDLDFKFTFQVSEVKLGEGFWPDGGNAFDHIVVLPS